MPHREIGPTEIGNDAPLSNDIFRLQWFVDGEAMSPGTLPSDLTSPTWEDLKQLARILIA